MTEWEQFFREKITKIFTDKHTVIDIGGGLRARKDKGNRFDPAWAAWIAPLLVGKDYKILDPVPDYSPDIIGDIHQLPFADNSQEAIVCIAVLEHVENPIKAADELYRALKPGGYCYVYVPFLYYYHAQAGYYKDYWRFTKDAIDLMFAKFSHKETASVRGAGATWLKLAPGGKYQFVQKIGNLLDRLTGKNHSYQVSGYNVFLIK